MMSLEMNLERKFAKEFLATQDLFNTIDFEIINTKDINDQLIFLVKFNKEFLAAQDLFNTIGFEIIGIKTIDNDMIYFVKKKGFLRFFITK